MSKENPPCLVFLDYENTFNSVETAAVMHGARQQGVGEIYRRILESVYTNGA